MGQFDEFERFDERPAACAVCEAMLPEAVDGTLSEAEQSAFNKHLAGCVECARELAAARRGAAWLSMLKSQAPEPPAGLLAKILAETTGAAQHDVSAIATPAPAAPTWQPAFVPAAEPLPGFTVQWAAFRKVWSNLLPTENVRAIFQP